MKCMEVWRNLKCCITLVYFTVIMKTLANSYQLLLLLLLIPLSNFFHTNHLYCVSGNTEGALFPSATKNVQGSPCVDAHLWPPGPDQRWRCSGWSPQGWCSRAGRGCLALDWDPCGFLPLSHYHWGPGSTPPSAGNTGRGEDIFYLCRSFS